MYTMSLLTTLAVGFVLNCLLILLHHCLSRRRTKHLRRRNAAYTPILRGPDTELEDLAE